MIPFKVNGIIRSELLNFGVKVIILEPGFFKTPLTNHARNVEMMKQVWSRADNQVIFQL